MNAHTGLATLGFWDDWAQLLFDAGGKSVLLLAGATVILSVWKRNAAATRHFIWLTAFAGLLALPVAALFSPAWSGPVWARTGNFVQRWEGNLISSVNAPQTLPPVSDVPGKTQAATVPGAETKSGLTAATPEKSRLDFSQWVLLVWAAGAGAVFFGLLVRFALLRRVERSAQIPTDHELEVMMESVRAELGLKRSARLILSTDSLMPMTWGWWRPVVLLPQESARWDRERLRVVLRHELAHVKRRDCLTQGFAHLVCGFYWFNPLAWLALRQMRLERERACDDLVLSAGARPSDYAEHLLDIARQFARAPRLGAIAMARSSSLEHRLRAIVDVNRRPGGLRPCAALVILVVIGGAVLCAGGCKSNNAQGGQRESRLLREQQLARLQTFSAMKEKQSQALAAGAGEKISPEYRRFFDAAIKGDVQTVTNMYESFKKRHPQYDNKNPDYSLRTSYWPPVLEISIAYDHLANAEPKYTQIAVDDIIHSIPAGSIYFGGTDPGRGLITAFSKSHTDADPFFTLTQNALADPTYLKYLRKMYGGKIYVATEDDSQKCFHDYLEDAVKRLKENRLKPGEDVKEVDGKIQVQGQIAVMAINGLLAKLIFDKNPGHEFYIEESFPLDWMFPNLSPNGVIMKINRQPLAELSEETVRRDHEYWSGRVAEMLGGWLTDETSVQKVAEFAEKVYARKDLSGFKGDPRYVRNDYACKCFSKWRSGIAGIYAWRVGALNGVPTPSEYLAQAGADRERMIHEADFAFRQAFALCPYSPEAVFRYVNFLNSQNRASDALRIAEAAQHCAAATGDIKGNGSAAQFENLVKELKRQAK